MSLSTGRLGVLFVALTALAAPSAKAQGTGTIEGRVLDNLGGDPLPGAGTPAPDAAGTPAHRSPRQPTCRRERPARFKNESPVCSGEKHACFRSSTRGN